MAPPAPVVGVSLQHDGFAPGGTAGWARCLHLEFRIRGHVVIAVLSLAVLTGIGTPPADAQSDPVPWGGTVEVRGGPLSVKAGESVTYFLRLSEPPTADGWWVRVHVDGVVWGDVGYKRLSWVPSVGWGFDQDDWYVWRGITIRAAEDAELDTQVTFTHEVWDHTAECPVHNVGSVRVRVTERTDPPSPPPRPDLPTLEIDDVEVSEHAGHAVFRVMLRGQSTETVTVRYTTADGTARAEFDYTTTNGTLTFGVGETAKTISVEVVDDGDPEGDETFTLSLSMPQNATLRDDVGIATITANDGGNPPPPPPPPPDLPRLEIDDVEVSEDAGTAVFSVTLSEQSDATVTVTFGTSNGSAIAGLDYTATNGTLVFQPGQQAKTIDVAVSDDTRQEGDETFTVSLSSPQNATLQKGVGTATIEDNDGTDLPTLAIDDVTVSEGGGNAVFSVILRGQTTETVTVEYETLDGTASAGSDYRTKNGTLRFLANETSKTIEVTVLDDIDVEGEETFRVTLTDPQNATLLDDVGIARIRDDEGVEPPQPGVPTLAINDVTVSEGDGSAVFSVILRGQSTGTVTVPYETSNGSAIADSDYTATSGTLLFQPGEQAKTIAVEVVDDSAAEGDEKFTVSLSEPPNATLLKGVGTATIVDNDGTDLPTLSNSGVTVTEGSGSAVFRVGLNKQSGDVVTVVYATSDGTATAGADYAATGGTLTFEPGETRQTISVEVLDDDEVEGDETFTVRLSNARNATLGVQEATGTIRDDESDGGRPPGLPELVIYDVAVAENAGSAVFRVGLSGESDQAVTVAYRTSDWTATAGADYTATNGTLVFQPGETRKAIAVPVLDDSEEEGDETFTMRLSDVRNATLGDPEGTGTIRDDDDDDPGDDTDEPSSPSRLPALVIDDVTVAEAGGSAPFTVSLSRQSGAAVTVHFGTSDWTATAGSDYTATSGTLTFAPGETRKTIAVPVLADDEEEEDEIFTVRLSDARNAALADHEGTGTIRDDEHGALQPMDRVTTDWIGHFGRTAAAQVVDALDERMRCARDRRSMEGTADHPSPRWRCTRSTVGVVPAGNPSDVPSTEQQDAPGWSLWGRGSFSRFDVEGEDARVLGGGVGTATFGVDLATGQVLLGIALSHSQGGGTVSIDDVAAQVTSVLTGFHPYLRLGVNDRLSLWGTVGIGTGTLTRTMDDDRTMETGIALRMAAVGGLAQILSPTEDHRLSVSIKADGLLLAIDANASASFAAASMDASRLRLVLEGAYDFVLGDGHWIAPFVDVGGRLDGGGVETGWGMEIGGGVRYAHPEQHLTAELYTRALPVHGAEGFRQWSLSGSLRYDPNASSELGPYFTLSSSRGLEEDGRHASWGIETIADPLQVGGAAAGWDVDTELGYGVSVLGGSATGTPWAGVSVSEGTPEYRLGYRLAFGSDLRVGLAGTLRDNATETEPPDYQVTLRLSTH